MANELKGKVALVTGGSRGIGREIALAFAAAGAHVAVGYNQRPDAASEVVKLIESAGGKAVAVQAEVSKPLEAERLVRDAEKALGPLDILVNNAGIAQVKPVEQVTNEDWEEMIRVNLSSTFYVSQAALPGMRARKFGRIIMLSSIAAQVGGIVGPHYAASKAGMIGLMHSYAVNLAKEGITANAIAPALIETDMLKQLPAANAAATSPVGRFGRVDEISDVAVLLASNGFINGQTINVNGGRYMSS
jgi:3-oxoacyl-[acyl-carrier protein] reductase